jgi:hypothetical protein
LCGSFLEIVVADVLVLGRSWKIIASESLGFVEVVKLVKMRLLMNCCRPVCVVLNMILWINSHIVVYR